MSSSSVAIFEGEVSLYRIPVKSEILTGTYILQSNRVKLNRNNIKAIYQLCHEDYETFQQIFITCKSLESDNKPILKGFIGVLSDQGQVVQK